MGTTVKQIDHIMIQSDFTEKVYRILQEELKLPIAWEMKSFGGIFKSGGLSFGAVNIEILIFPKIFRTLGIVPNRNGIIGIAFEPAFSIENTVKELNSARIKFTSPKPFKTKINGEKKTRWINLSLKRFLPKSRIFFCKYTFDCSERRDRTSGELKKLNGGPLGIEEVEEINISAADDKTLDLWTRLFDLQPQESETISIKPKEGPVINIAKGKENRILNIVIRVKSLERAKAAIASSSKLSLNESDEILIKLDKVIDLGLKLKETCV